MAAADSAGRALPRKKRIRRASRASDEQVRQQRGPMDLTFLVLVLTLLSIGLIMLFSASYAYAYYHDGNSFYYITRQLTFAVIGVVGMLVVSRIDFTPVCGADFSGNSGTAGHCADHPQP